MVTNWSINLTEEERAKLHLMVTGKKGLATREMITKFAEAQFNKGMKQMVEPAKEGELVRMMPWCCTKCQKPVSVPIPKSILKREEATEAGGPPSEGKPPVVSSQRAEIVNRCLNQAEEKLVASKHLVQHPMLRALKLMAEMIDWSREPVSLP